MIKELTMEKNTYLNNWEEVALGQLCKLTRGHNPPKSKFIHEPRENYVRFYQIRDGWSDKHIVFVPNTPQLHKVEPTDMLMVAYRHIGRVFRGVEGAFNVALCKISNTSREKLDDDFLFYMIPTDIIKGELMKRSERSLIPSMSVNHLKEITIPLPPLAQQKKIVDILDKAFAAIDTAKANAEQNLQNTKELFESYLQNVFENKGDNWEEKTIGDLGKPSMCKRILKQQTSSDGDIPFYKIGTFGKTPNAFISKELYEEYKTKYSFPKKGDILLSASGTIGRRVIYDGKPAFFQDSNIVWIDNDEKQVLNEYLYSFYGFCDWQPSKGATISRLYNANLKRIKITFPKSLKEQKIVIQKIDSLSIQTKNLEAIYTQKIADLEEMKKSVLQKAFSGQLNTKN